MSVLNKAELYLQQQRSLFGETLFAEYAAEPVPMPHSSTSHIQSTPSIATDIITDIATDITTDIAPASSVAADWQTAPTLEVLREKIHTCLHCKLGATRTKFVFGVGNPNADIMVIGEAPGADEDALGEPFVGRGGQLLTKILEAIALKREDVYIANIIKCRPPDNRRPEPDEVAQCEPYLHRQLDLVQPKFILAVGLTAVNTLLKANHQMGKIRGTVLSFRGVPLIPTYHPAALLRNPEWKKSTWEDVQLLRRLYDEYLAKQA
jgi:uracil-DNA glycosylase